MAKDATEIVPKRSMGPPAVDIEAIRELWDEFGRVVKTIKPGDIESFRKANQTLGFNLAYGARALLKEVDRLDAEVARLEGRLAKAGKENDDLRADLRKATTPTPKYVEAPGETTPYSPPKHFMLPGEEE